MLGVRRTQMEILIADDPQRDNLYAEIQLDGRTWAEVIFDDEKKGYVLTIFAGDSEDEWFTFDLAQARKVLLDAKNVLVARGYPDVAV